MYKRLFLFLLVISPLTYSKECVYGDANTCPKESYCVFIEDPKTPQCLKSFSGEIPSLAYPFGPKQKSQCWKSIDPNGDSSHAWLNARYAIDIHSKKDERATLFASASGKIIAFSGCKENQPQCNSGFGNQVKLLTKDGFLIYYAHLDKLLVKTGDQVDVGTPIGIEGATGNVGDMWGTKNDFHHLHFSVHYDWRKHSETYHLNTWPGLPSIPFKFKICDSKIQNKCKPIQTDIRDFPCRKTSNEYPYIIGTGF